MNNSDMKELCTLENGNQYFITNRIIYNKDFYVLLINRYDNEDILIQKEEIINNSIYFSKISSQEELEMLLKVFANQNIY